MKVFVVGATGMAGSAFVKAAVKQGIAVVANGRSEEKLTQLKEEVPQIEVLAKDAFTLTKEDFAGCAAVLDAFATTPNKAYLQTDLAAHLVHLLRENSKIRLGVILGAGSLTTGSDHHLVVKDFEKDPTTKSWRATPQNQYKEYQFLQNVDNVDWFGVSPALSFIPGKKTAKILSGDNELLYNDHHESVTTAGTMAAALVDELITPKHHQTRFTVANG
ncbi:NAD(P)H-binding protein [Lactobacillus sp. ESL0791]|uniref:NAD(P)-dependent oxidoreductase n=1 Tax=Lactobacillus sp. ESL0791 TaxID=2983234 RepID=UPI0023F85995|nr:NAD(P)H-binding protein [Lactobacillus sp. ESL0791]MDF7638668.1 NAD(P)H-binding protein [Lactobacillus sp. ESL0791]